jgi:hypothetical protein
MIKLTSGDRYAIDLVLGETVTAGTMPHHGFIAKTSPQNVLAVQQVLHALDALPAAEPPTDLVSRTLKRLGLRAVPNVNPADMGGAAHRHHQRPA